MGWLQLGVPGHRLAAATVAPLLGLVLAAACPSSAVAGGALLLRAEPFAGGIGDCELEANGAGEKGDLLNESALVVSSNDFHSEVADDGTITKWTFDGGVTGNAAVSLDIFSPGFATGPELAQQVASPDKEFGVGEDVVAANIPVVAGEGIGVTVSAATDATEKEGNGALVVCSGGADKSESILAIWESPLIIGQAVVPSSEGPGEVAVSAHVEYDAPVVTSIFPTSGPALGGQEVTIKGEHLANASAVYFPEGVAPVKGKNSNTEITVITPEAVTEGAVEGGVRTAGGLGKFKYVYEGAPRPRTPELVLEPVTAITRTSAQLNATVNLKELVATICGFGYTAQGVEEEEEEEGALSCEPFPGPFGDAPQAVSAKLTALSPATTYRYSLAVVTEFGERHGNAHTDGLASFTTLGASSGGETPAKEPTATAPHEIPPAKELAAVVPAAAVVGGGSLTATTAGLVHVKVSCPADESTCSGTITLKTIGAVSATTAAEAKKAVLTLAVGSFKVAGGKVEIVGLHLSKKARALLERVRTLRARATVVARDPAGATHTTVSTVRIRAAKAKH